MPMLKSLRKCPTASVALLGAMLFSSSSAFAIAALSCPQCLCSGGVTHLRLRYEGPDGATVRVEDDHGQVVIFSAVLNNGDTFDLDGSRSNGKFLKNKLEFFVDDVADTDIHVSCSRPIGVGFIFGSFVIEEFASVDGGLVNQTCQPSCPCDGGVTFLRLRYSGPDGAQVRIEDDNGNLIIFDAPLNDGDIFELNGSRADGTFVKKTLGFFVDDVADTGIHVSCSQPIGTGFVYGSFTVTAFASRQGGFFDGPCPATCLCSGGVTFLRMRYGGVNGASVTVEDNSGAIFGPSPLNGGDEFDLFGSREDGKFNGNNLGFYVDGGLDTNIHVSCSDPIDIGFVFGSFTVESLASRDGGLCVEGCCGDNIRDANEDCDGTADAACPGACNPDCICASDPCEGVVEIDCNGNGSQDSCDLALGTSEDCNANGIPDECDIADCDGLPACDDCNLNGVPDGCDIFSGGWPDIDPVDGVPDDCVVPDGTDGDWTDDIWDLADEDPENPYPDNQDAVSDLHVTIDGFTVFLDDTVEVQTLRLLNGGTLLVAQCEVGDFATVVGGILNEGQLLVGGDRHIDATGSDVTIGPGGLYAATPTTCATVCPSGTACGSLSARNLVLTAGDCASLRNGADILLDQSMSVDLSGDLVLLGNPYSGCEAGRGVLPRGIDIPPKFRLTRPATASARNIELNGFSTSSNTIGSTAASGDVGAPGGASGFSVFGIRMSGDFVNHSLAPSLFDWVTGYLTAVGTEQVFEVAGIDFGPSEEGFLTTDDTLFDFGPHTNFAIGTLDVRAGSHMTFVNDFANTVGDGPCEEAFYVKRLILHEGATLTLDNVNVYYETLDTGGAGAPGDGVIELLGCGTLKGLCNAQRPAIDSVAKNRFISITTGIPGRQQAIRVILDDLPAPFDLLNGQAMWVGEPTAINESASTATPEAGAPSFWASELQCTPYFADWSALGTVHVYHQAVVPGGSYPIQVVDQSCRAGFEEDFSAPTYVSMARFGDIVGTCGNGSCTPPNGVVDILDLFAVIKTFISVPGAVSKVRADLEPAVPDFLINISDALVVVDAFVGVRYPFAPPENPCGSP